MRLLVLCDRRARANPRDLYRASICTQPSVQSVTLRLRFPRGETCDRGVRYVDVNVGTARRMQAQGQSEAGCVFLREGRDRRDVVSCYANKARR